MMLPPLFYAWAEHITLAYDHKLQGIHKRVDCPVVECKACGGACHFCTALALMREAQQQAEMQL